MGGNNGRAISIWSRVWYSNWYLYLFRLIINFKGTRGGKIMFIFLAGVSAVSLITQFSAGAILGSTLYIAAKTNKAPKYNVKK